MDFAEIKARHDLAEIVRRYGGVELKNKGRELVGLCPFHDDHTPSFAVVPSKGIWVCHPCGCCGDVLDFVAKIDGCTLGQAAKKLAGELGDIPVERRAQLAEQRRNDQKKQDDQDRKNQEYARRIWNESQPDARQVREYLAGRGLDHARLGRQGGVLRYHPNLKHGPTGRVLPAMVAPVYNQHGILTAVHRTYLQTENGAVRKAELPGGNKLMLGKVAGGHVPLALRDADEHRACLGLCEGIETGLAVLQSTATAVLACLSTSGMRNFRMPKSCSWARRIVVWADHDEPDRTGLRPGRREADMLAERLSHELIDVEVAVLEPE